MIEVTVTTTAPVESDRRYRVMVLLNRSDRPSYYKFHCPKCTMVVGELVNTEITAMSDIINMDTFTGTGVRCDGRTGNGRCSTWYYFSLGA